MIIAPVIPIFVIIILLVIVAGLSLFCLINKRTRKMRTLRRIIIALLFIALLLRPAFGGGHAERDLSNLNIYFIVDNTGSMAARDMDNGTKFRYEKVTADIQSIIKLFPGSKYAAISLDYNIFQPLPLVNDADTAYSYAKTIKPKNSTLSSDSNLSELLSYSTERIKKYSERYPERKSLVFFFSDGEDTSNATTIPSELKGLVSGGAIIGYGSLEGSRINKIEYDGTISENSYVRERFASTEHISSLNEKNMSAIADRLGLKYYRRSGWGDLFDDTAKFINSDAIITRGSDIADASLELYWIIAIGIIILLLFEFMSIIDMLLLERKAAK